MDPYPLNNAGCATSEIFQVSAQFRLRQTLSALKLLSRPNGKGVLRSESDADAIAVTRPMTGAQLEHALGAACDVSGSDEVYVFGSQANCGQYPGTRGAAVVCASQYRACKSLSIENQIDDRQIAQVAPGTGVEVLIPLPRDSLRCSSSSDCRRRVGEERADILCRQPAHRHAAHQIPQFARARLQPLGQPRLKRLLGPAQLRHRELQQAGLRLHMLRLRALTPARALTRPAAAMLSAEQRRRSPSIATCSMERASRPTKPTMDGSEDPTGDSPPCGLLSISAVKLDARWDSLMALLSSRPAINGADSA